jgi:hypothetical protein
MCLFILKESVGVIHKVSCCFRVIFSAKIVIIFLSIFAYVYHLDENRKYERKTILLYFTFTMYDNKRPHSFLIGKPSWFSK